MTGVDAGASERPKRVTSADVAQASGVSRTTVSYVLNGRRDVRVPEATRAKVVAVAAELGYAPSAAARALKTGRNRLVLLLVPDWAASAGFARFAAFLSSELAARDLALVTHLVVTGNEDFRNLWTEIEPAAVASFFSLDSATVAAMRAAGIGVQVGLFDRPPQDDHEFPSPEEQLGRTQVDHLLQRGHTRLGFVGPDDPTLAPFATGRLAGVRAACAEYGLLDPLVGEVGEATPTADLVRHWVREDGVTAICAYNDDLALAVLTAAARSGIGVPADLAVIGVDDEAAGRLTTPALTSASYAFAVVAQFAAALVEAQLEGRPAPALPPPDALVRLVIRQST